MEKKNILNVILIVLVIALAGYIAYDKVLSNTNSQSSSSKSKATANVIDDVDFDPESIADSTEDNKSSNEESKDETKEENKDEEKQDSKENIPEQPTQNIQTVESNSSDFANFMQSNCYMTVLKGASIIISHDVDMGPDKKHSLTELKHYNNRDENYIKSTLYMYFEKTGYQTGLGEYIYQTYEVQKNHKIVKVPAFELNKLSILFYGKMLDDYTTTTTEPNKMSRIMYKESADSMYYIVK